MQGRPLEHPSIPVPGPQSTTRRGGAIYNSREARSADAVVFAATATATATAVEIVVVISVLLLSGGRQA